MKVKTCLRYAGGKYYGFKKIKKYLVIKHDEYREPFIGGASIFLGKELSPQLNWINDIDEDLINFYQVIKNDNTKDQLYKLINNEVVNKERYSQILNLKPEDKIQRAFKYFYLNRTSFSGIMYKPRWGYLLGSSVTPDKWESLIEPVSKKLKNVKITSKDYKDVILAESHFSNVLIYLDPPYYKASKLIYKNEFSIEEHIRLCDILKKTQYNFLLSYNNHPELIEMYSWANIEELSWTYFLSEERRQKGKELLITNYSIDKQLNINV